MPILYHNLWIPIDNSDRSATINLNHMCGEKPEEDGFFHGFNGNCMTEYIVIPAPHWINTDADITLVAKAVIGREANFRSLNGSHADALVKYFATQIYTERV